MGFGHPYEDGKGCQGSGSAHGCTQPPRSSRAWGAQGGHPGLSLWEQERRQQLRRRAAREETQNNRQGNPTQNNELAFTKRKGHCLKATIWELGGVKKEWLEATQCLCGSKEFLFYKENNAGEQCGYLRRFRGSRFLFFLFSLIENKLELLP